MGDETRRTFSKLDDVIRTMAVTMARVETKQCAIHEDVKEVKTEVTHINGRVDTLESWKDKSGAAKKTTAKWVSGIVVLLGLLLTVFKIWG